MADKIYVGVDLHKTQFTICVKIDGQYLEEGTKFSMNTKGYGDFSEMMLGLALASGDVPVVLAIESTSNSRFFKNTMEANGFEVVVVNTLRFKVINVSTKKTDKNDARTIVDFLEKDMLPQSHLCSAKSESLRRILKSRSLMVQDAVALKNQAHAIMTAYGLATKPAQFQSRKSRNLVLETVTEEIQEVLIPIFEAIDTVEMQKKKMERHLQTITSDDNDVKLLMTIPGVGIVNACTIRAYIDDINRFETYKNFSAYCGLVPWVQSSNESTYYGRITKHGPQELRTALVQCVVAMVRMEDHTADYSIMKQYQKLKGDKSSGTSIIATARKLTRIIYTMLKTGTPFQEARMKRN